MSGSHIRTALHLFVAFAAAGALIGATPGPVQAHKLDNAYKQRQHIKDRARSQIGTPYRYGGTSPRSGFDCSGFTRWVFEGHGARLPRTSSDQYRLARREGFLRIQKRTNLKVGDLVFHRTGGRRVGHAGIFIGRGRFISATSSGGVRVRSIWDRHYWGPRWVGGVRVPATRH